MKKFYSSEWLWKELSRTNSATIAKHTSDALFKRAARAMSRGQISGDDFQTACDDLVSELEAALIRAA